MADEREEARRLLAWYRANRRDLPWRRTRDPYRILVSEVMLQQTRVSTVEKRYQEFLDQFPTAEALAGADEDEVLKAWEGLGYYRRARSLRAAARAVCERHGGVVPCGEAELLALPGIGAYTAAAVRAISYGAPALALDANAFRVFSRLGGIEEPAESAAFRQAVEALARGWLEGADPADFAQAVMELGSLVCVRTPRCGECPVAEGCVACGKGIQGELPRHRARQERRRETLTMLAFVRPDGRVGLQRRPDEGLLAGMYGFPMAQGHFGPEEAETLARGLDPGVLSVSPGPAWEHAFTHVTWDVMSLVARTEEGPGGLVWADAEEIAGRHAIPSAFSPLARAAMEAAGC